MPHAFGSSPVPTAISSVRGGGGGIAPTHRETRAISVAHSPRGPADQLEMLRARASPGTGVGASEHLAVGAATGPCSPGQACFVPSAQAEALPKNPSRLRPQHSTRSPWPHLKKSPETSPTVGESINDFQAGHVQSSGRSGGRVARNSSAGQQRSFPSSRAHRRSPAANALAGSHGTNLASSDFDALEPRRSSPPAARVQHCITFSLIETRSAAHPQPFPTASARTRTGASSVDGPAHVVCCRCLRSDVSRSQRAVEAEGRGAAVEAEALGAAPALPFTAVASFRHETASSRVNTEARATL
jgi:hypothetical protein